MKTGRDVVIGAILGADEFGFATAPLVVEGCIMMRKCHLNTCPVGVATQDPVLRKKFEGKPEHVVNYFFHVAEEARELMARLGVRTINELIGRTELLDTRKGIEHWKAKGLDFSRVFAAPRVAPDVAVYHQEKQDHGLEKALDNRLIELARPALERREKVTIDTPIRNINRTVGTMLSYEIAKRYGHEGLPDDTVHVRFAGSAGQSFGAFLAHGVTLDLVGDTNDYCGKGLSGGRISVQPSPKFRGEATENIITGNVVLYGAIAGEAYFRGVAGERFAVRNSGAHAVVEGVGDHGCEYMTGGTAVILGRTGENFGAGMTGGMAFILDEDGDFPRRANPESIIWRRLGSAWWEAQLKALIAQHAVKTDSRWSNAILDDWDRWRDRFWQVVPKEMLERLEHPLDDHADDVEMVAAE
jgi:glutamate synthase (NADPH/NADH) large chain